MSIRSPVRFATLMVAAVCPVLAPSCWMKMGRKRASLRAARLCLKKMLMTVILRRTKMVKVKRRVSEVMKGDGCMIMIGLIESGINKNID